MSLRVRARRLAEDVATWPSLTLTLEVIPWHWRIVPFIYRDWDCTPSTTVQWLFVKVEFFANRPLFPIEPVTSDPAPIAGQH